MDWNGLESHTNHLFFTYLLISMQYRELCTKLQPEQRCAAPIVAGRDRRFLPVSSVSLLYPRSPAEITLLPTTPGRGIFSPLFTAALEHSLLAPCWKFCRNETRLGVLTQTLEWYQCGVSGVRYPCDTTKGAASCFRINLLKSGTTFLIWRNFTGSLETRTTPRKNQQDEFFIVFCKKHKILTYLSLCTTFLFNCF